MNNPTLTMTRFDFLIIQIPKRVLIITELLLAGISAINILDWSLRILTASVTAIVGYWAVRAYKRKIKMDNIDIQIKEQQLARLLEENLERSKSKIK